MVLYWAIFGNQTKARSSRLLSSPKKTDQPPQQQGVSIESSCFSFKKILSQTPRPLAFGAFGSTVCQVPVMDIDEVFEAKDDLSSAIVDESPGWARWDRWGRGWLFLVFFFCNMWCFGWQKKQRTRVVVGF